MMETSKRMRRSEAELIADLQAKIANLKARAEERQAAKDPAVRYVKRAIKAIDKAAAATKDGAMRQALGEARNPLAACLGLNDVLVPSGRGSTRAASSRVTVTEDELLAHVRAHPNQRAEQISAALGTDSSALRPVMKRLIEAGSVKSKGEKRATTYAAR